MSGPRRATKRWTEGQPEYVLACYDNGGKTFDRYTILTGGTWRDEQIGRTDVEYFGASENPTHPQGFGQWGEMPSMNRKACGKQIKWLDLPFEIRDYLASLASRQD